MSLSREAARKFHFLREIAAGGFGSVYLAKVMHADGFSRLAAVKLLHQQWSENAEIARRMRDEARLLGWLRHRNIVDVLGLTTIGGRVAVVMEYLEAVDLKAVVQAHAERGEPVPPRGALEALGFVASALDAAYNRPPYQGERPLRVIHRDIKPSNIMLDESGTVKVLDFGVARAEFDQRESNTQEMQFGSIDYMPPERLFMEPDTPASDVYSLGATLFELLALERFGKARSRAEKHGAFLDERLEFLRNTTPAMSGTGGEQVIELLRSMLAHRVEQRPTASELVTRCRALSRAFDGDGLTEWAERSVPPLVKAMREAPREPNPLTDSILTEDGGELSDDDVEVDAIEDASGVGSKPAKAATPPPTPKSQTAARPVAAAAPPLAPPKLAPAAPAKPAAASAPSATSVPMPRKPAASGATIIPDDEPERSSPSVAGADLVSAVFLKAQKQKAYPPPTHAPPPAPAQAPPQAPSPPVAPVPPVASAPAQAPPQPLAPPVAPAPQPPASPRLAHSASMTVIPDLDESPTSITAAPAEVSKTDHVPSGTQPSVATETKTPPALRQASPLKLAPAPLLQEPEPAPPSRFPIMLGVLVVLGFLGVVALVGLWAVWSWVNAPIQVIAPAPVASPAQDVLVGEKAPVVGDLVFRSAAPDTAKVTVTCDGKETTGGTEAAAMGTPASCTVKVILKDRTRVTTELSAPSPGTYTCFVDGAKDCVK